MQAGILAWILPGAGHFYLGQRGMAAVFFIAISFPYWTGLAVGGVMNSVNPREEKPRDWGVQPRGNKWLFLAEMCTGGYTTACYFIGVQLEQRVMTLPVEERVKFMSYYPGSDVAQIYLATAGLLNLLAMLDAMSRAQYAGSPTFRRELAAKEAAKAAAEANA